MRELSLYYYHFVTFTAKKQEELNITIIPITSAYY